MWTQLVAPDTSVKANAGMCLAFVQSVYGAPVRYRSAWDAWQATTQKHTDQLPTVSVPVWFSHYGTYGQPPSYENWGHVVAYVPSRGFLSSPGRGYGSEWLATIEEVERRFNSKYVGWSEDINGLQVATGSNSPVDSGFIFGEEMRVVVGQPSNRRVAVGELTWQVLPGEQASYCAHIWESAPGSNAAGEPLVISDENLDLEIGQIQKRRAQLAEAFKDMGL